MIAGLFQAGHKLPGRLSAAIPALSKDGTAICPHWHIERFQIIYILHNNIRHTRAQQ